MICDGDCALGGSELLSEDALVDQVLSVESAAAKMVVVIHVTHVFD